MQFNSNYFDLLPESFQNNKTNISICDNSASHSLTLFDTPLTDVEMDYFNNTLKSFNHLYTKYKFIFTNEDLQYYIYYKIKNIHEMLEIIDFVHNTSANNFIQDFHTEFNFNHISNEQILYLFSYCFFDTYGDDSHFSMEARDGMVYFSHKTINNFSPRVRDRLSMFFSLFFDEKYNIFNGIDNTNEKVISPRNYCTLLDCYNYQKGKENKFCYLMSQKRSVSTNDMSWHLLSQMHSKEFIQEFYNMVLQYSLKDFLNYEDEKKDFTQSLISSCFELSKAPISLNASQYEKVVLKNLFNNISLRYNFSDIKFKNFFSDINRVKELYKTLQNHPQNNEVRKAKGKI